MKKTERRKNGPRLGRIRWIIGTPYFVQGTRTFTEVPILYFIKYGLGMGDAGGQLFDALRQSGWFIKPLWGLISDKVPLFVYISLAFTLLTIPFIEMLRHELDRRGVDIRLGGSS